MGLPCPAPHTGVANDWLQSIRGPPVLPALGPHDDGEETDDKRSGWRCHPCRRGTRGVPGGGAPIVMLQPWWHSLLGMCG
jgi:hypothetical protein